MRWRTLLRWFGRRDREAAPLAFSGRQAGAAEGFSLLELERTGLTEREAEQLGIPIDRGRRTSLGSNVVLLEKRIGRPRR